MKSILFVLLLTFVAHAEDYPYPKAATEAEISALPQMVKKTKFELYLRHESEGRFDNPRNTIKSEAEAMTARFKIYTAYAKTGAEYTALQKCLKDSNDRLAKRLK